jgi:hypothetical protein
MSTFTFGFVISQLTLLNRTDFQDPHIKNLCIKVYARPELHKDLDQTVMQFNGFKVIKSIEILSYRESMRELKNHCCQFNVIWGLIFLWKSWTLLPFRVFRL